MVAHCVWDENENDGHQKSLQRIPWIKNKKEKEKKKKENTAMKNYIVAIQRKLPFQLGCKHFTKIIVKISS